MDYRDAPEEAAFRGRLRAWGQAIANLFRRLFGRRRPS